MTFLGYKTLGSKGSVAPDAWPIPTIVPLARIAFKFVSNLAQTPISNPRSSIYVQVTKHNVRVLADPAENRMHVLSTSDLQHPRHDILILVQNNVVRAVRPRDRRLLRRARRPDHYRSAVPAHLREPQPKTARDGVHENSVPTMHIVRFGRERQRGEALHEPRRADAGRHCGRERDDGGPIGDGVLGERPLRR